MWSRSPTANLKRDFKAASFIFWEKYSCIIFRRLFCFQFLTCPFAFGCRFAAVEGEILLLVLFCFVGCELRGGICFVCCVLRSSMFSFVLHSDVFFFIFAAGYSRIWVFFRFEIEFLVFFNEVNQESVII